MERSVILLYVYSERRTCYNNEVLLRSDDSLNNYNLNKGLSSATEDTVVKLFMKENMIPIR